MNTLKYLFFAIIAIGFVACDEEEPVTPLMPPTVNLGMDQTTTIESLVTLDGSAMSNTGNLSWTVSAPDGTGVILDNGSSSNPSFRATQEGMYNVSLQASNADGTTTMNGIVTVNNVTYTNRDQMGRPAINTVFNYFGDATTKNGYNQTLPSDGSMNADAFKGIFDALQGYIGLDPVAYRNILGLDNATTAGVLAVDVLGSDKTAGSAYGTLNGRALADDVVDVTLLLTFNDQSGNTSALIPGLISDNVNANDKAFLDVFPYLASPH